MGRLGVLFAFLLLFYHCKNVEKLMDQGSYEQVIRHSVKKLQGKKKKIDYVRALEGAWARYSQEKESQLLRLAKANNRQDWRSVIQLTEEVNDLQNLIRPLTPLKATNGYRANFNWLKTQEWKNRGVERFLDLSWQDYDQYILAARKGNKDAAQQAFGILQNIQAYENHSQMNKLLGEAQTLGTTYVLAKLVRHPHSNVRRYSMEMLRQLLNTQSRKEGWTVLHYDKQPTITYDFIYEISYYSIFVSNEQTNTVIDRIHRDVKVGEEAVRDNKGKVVLDTAGNVIMQDVMERVYAEVITQNQVKEAIVEIEVALIPRGQANPVQTEKLSSQADFTNAYQDWRGDRRAFEGNPTRGAPLPFPEDAQLILQCTEELQRTAERLLFRWL